MKSSLGQNSLLLCRTAKASSESGSEGTEHETICWLRHLSEPVTVALISECHVRSEPFP